MTTRAGQAAQKVDISASDTTQQLEDKVSKLSRQVKTLSEKCLDLEGPSKRQNLRVVGVTEGKEAGHKMRDIVAQLLKDVLNSCC